MIGQSEWAVERLGDAPRPGARALLLGNTRSPAAGRAAELSAGLAARGWTPVAIDDVDVHSFEEGSAEGALLLGVLEHTEWDRWLLQRVHRALVPGGRIVLTAEDASRLASLEDLRYWMWGAIKTIRLRLTGKPGKFRKRRYRSARLRRMIEDLGFEEESFELHPSRGFQIVARRVPSLFGLAPERPYPDAREFRRRGRGGAYIATRDSWAREFPEWVSPPRELDPVAHGKASVLVLAPHPDDELIGCGGTSARLIDAGAVVHVVHATDGSEAASLWNSPEELKRRVRLEEAERVAKAAGYASFELWREPNDAFRADDANVERVAAALARVRPRLVFVPFVSDVHADHRALAVLLARALERTPLPPEAKVASYEVWSNLPANAWCDVTAQMPRLERLLWLYETAMKVDDYVHFCAERNHYNALAVAGRAGFAEVFHLLPAARYPQLVRATGMLS